ncbi:MAG: hypothetical protein RL021_787 [Bacteroidota bacterium]|jgi:cytochrome c oxidase cbb3-type subunit 3
MNTIIKKKPFLSGLFIYLLMVVSAVAQPAAETVVAKEPLQLPQILWSPSFYLWLLLGIIVVAVLFTLSHAIRVLGDLMQERSKVFPSAIEKTEEYKERPNLWISFMRSMTRSVPVEQEKDVLLDHDYDGIRELDNQLPPWWKYGFYVTIVFAVVYLFSYHLSGSGKLQIAEYDEQMAVAEAEKTEMMKRNAEYVTEANVTRLTDEALLADGKGIFEKNCVACHKSDGGGSVGPNLTDDYWIHGGGISNLFKTIREGVPAKGMISWKSQLSPKQIQQVASYVLTLHGTNPSGAKEPQGDLWKETASPADSSVSDSTVIAGI